MTCSILLGALLSLVAEPEQSSSSTAEAEATEADPEATEADPEATEADPRTSAPEASADDTPGREPSTDEAEAPATFVDATPPEPPFPDHVRVYPPAYRGTGLFIGSAAAFVLVAGYQVGDVLLCGGCAAGFVERIGLAAGIGSAVGGGIVRAYSDTWHDTAQRRKPRSVRGTLVAGSVLVGVGAALGLTNEALWWGCWIGGAGPYAFENSDDFGTFIDCRHGVPQALADGASMLVAAGGGLLGYSLTYRKRQAMFRRAKIIGWSPPSLVVGRGGMTVQVGGRF